MIYYFNAEANLFTNEVQMYIELVNGNSFFTNYLFLDALKFY